MVDALANTTTLLYGDPAKLSLPAGLPVVGSLTAGVYSPVLYPAARHSASLAYDAYTRTLWLFGGAYHSITAQNNDKHAFFEDMWSFSLDRRQWAWWRGNTDVVSRPSTPQTVLDTAPPPPTAAAATAAYKGQIVIYGGT